ncbi:dTDP-4-dehydrorhamnose reductase [Pseudalkalibacillus caeni]|uniref:dTDP-4-dehydrorhamnose reductase n=1 Tax=Exobacillus caeni TaxID=2574798 RepID=A0A5R9F4R1_9BACL|nr:dTDP-4-dehydrorhamnose reductase [Pseudalkalibacillus caeni]TLS37479.1 dTDP-4-dehydrorhamnose reductase [Pseudalkalibacillus caeni]
MKILVTGVNGQLGKELFRKLSLQYSVVGKAKKELDITNYQEVKNIMEEITPDIVFNAAAYTNVDQCEINRKKALEVNSLGSFYVAKAANSIGAKVFHYSTDYVFDGTAKVPYEEKDMTNPQSMYGLSKWLGEELVLNSGENTIIRTSWLYGHGGKNFVNTMINLAEKNEKIKVVNDQIGSPTYINDLAEVTESLMHKKSGLYHITNSGACSWYIFAKAILEEAGLDSGIIIPTTTREYGAIAPRPSFSILDNLAMRQENINSLRPWQEALRDYIRKELTR